MAGHRPRRDTRQHLVDGMVCGSRDDPRRPHSRFSRGCEPNSPPLSEGLPALSDAPGSLPGVHLVVEDVDAARAALIERGVAVDPVVDLGGGVRMAGFADTDGNTWALQQLG